MKSGIEGSCFLRLDMRQARRSCVLLTLSVLALTALGIEVSSQQPNEPNRAPGGDLRVKDRCGDALPAFAVARLGTVRLKHSDGVGRPVFAPDGGTLACVGLDDVRLWSVADGRLLRRLDLSQDPSLPQRPGVSYYPGASTPVFSPDGKALALPCEVRHRAEPAPGAAAPNEKRLTRIDGKVLVCDVAGKGATRLLGEDGRTVNGCAYSADGKLLAWDSARSDDGSAPTIVVSEAESGKVVRQIDLPSKVRSLCGSPSDNLVAAVVEDGTAGLWDIAKGTRVRLFKAPGEAVCFAAFSPHGKAVAVASYVQRDALPGQSGDVYRFSVWSVRSGETLLEFRQASSARKMHILDMGFVPPGELLAALLIEDDEGGIKTMLATWNAATGRLVQKRRVEWSWDRMAFSPDGKMVAFSAGLAVALRRFPDGSDPLELRGHVLAVPFVAFLTPGLLVSWGWDTKILLWDVGAAQPVWELSNTDRYYPSACGPQAIAVFPRRNLLAVAFRGRTVEIWNTADRRRQKTLPVAHEQLLSALQFSPDGGSLACGDLQGNVWVLDVQSGRTLRKWSRDAFVRRGWTEDEWARTNGFPTLIDANLWLPHAFLTRVPVAGPGMEIQALAWSADGKTIVAATSANARWLDVKTGKLLRESPASKEATERYVTFSPDGKVLAELSNTVQHTLGCVVWDSATGRQIRKDTDTGSVFSGSALAFSSDSSLLAQGLGASLRLVDAATGRQRATVSTGEVDVVGLSFSADGRLLAAGGVNGNILVFDVAQVLASEGGKSTGVERRPPSGIDAAQRSESKRGRR